MAFIQSSNTVLEFNYIIVVLGLPAVQITRDNRNEHATLFNSSMANFSSPLSVIWKPNCLTLPTAKVNTHTLPLCLSVICFRSHMALCNDWLWALTFLIPVCIRPRTFWTLLLCRLPVIHYCSGPDRSFAVMYWLIASTVIKLLRVT